MGYKMNGSPAKLGEIQGTAGHKSALKQKVKTYEEAWHDIDYDPEESEAKENIPYRKKDKWGRVYGKENIKKVKKGQYGKVKGTGVDKGRTEFIKAAKAWNMKTYGTENPTRDYKKAGLSSKKELAAQFKASKTTTPKDDTPKVGEKVVTPKVVKKGDTEKKTDTYGTRPEAEQNIDVRMAKRGRKTAKKSAKKTSKAGYKPKFTMKRKGESYDPDSDDDFIN